MPKKRIQYRLFLVLLLLALLSMGCWLSDALRAMRGGVRTLSDSKISDQLLATSAPTLTPCSAEEPDSEATPSPMPKEQPTAAEGGEEEFRLEITEQELTDWLDESGFAAQGVAISDIRVKIVPDWIVVTFYAQHAATGMAGQVTLRGVPVVLDGDAYLDIIEVELGSSFSGLARMIAKRLLQAAIDEYEGEKGIPIPMEDVVIERIELGEGVMLIIGMSSQS